MALDVAAKRLSAASTIRDKGFLLTIEQPVYAGGIRIDPTTVRAHALQTMDKRSRPGGKNVRQTDLSFVISALTADTSGNLTSTVLQLAQGDKIVLNGSRLEVTDPGTVSPARTLTGAPDPILYKASAAVHGHAS